MNPAKILILAAAIVGTAADCHAEGKDAQCPPPNVKHIIDTHIHIYDTSRPNGVPWPPEDDEVLYKPHLPDEFKRVARAGGATGAIIVEASDRLDDNRWVLDLVEDDDFFVAVVGNIDPYREDFAVQLNRYRQDERFVGLRARNKTPIDYMAPRVLANFRRLAKAGLTLDILANGRGVDGVKEVTRLARAVPNLRIVVDHVLGFDINGQPPSKQWIAAVEQLARNKNVYCKVSGLYQRCVQQPAPQDVDHYRTILDVLWLHFGSKRLVFGSNWPCTKKSGSYKSFVRLVNAYFREKGESACEHYFWKNAVAAYNLQIVD